MGVTIHFEGQLKSETAFNEIIKIAENFAIENDMPYNIFEKEDVTLLRVHDENDSEYIGKTKGIRIQPNNEIDSLNLEFDTDLYIQEFCKTQFSSISMHIRIIEFLRKIEPLFYNFNIVDEGEYWELSNPDILEDHFLRTFDMIEEAKRENPNLSGPYRSHDGRIIDLMKN